MKLKNKFILLSLIAMSLLIASPNVFAQKTGTLKGQVLDQSESGVPNATIIIGMNSQQFETKVDKDGKFELSLPEGTYNLIVRANGFMPSRKRQIKIIARQTTETNITLFVQLNQGYVEVTPEPDNKPKKDVDKP